MDNENKPMTRENRGAFQYRSFHIYSVAGALFACVPGVAGITDIASIPTVTNIHAVAEFPVIAGVPLFAGVPSFADLLFC
jgi:hypothetical protein